MSASVNFYGPELKTERAEQHIAELERIFSVFVRKNTQALFAKTKKRGDYRSLTIGGEFPRHTSTVIGDAVHNLRAALDHAYCLLVEANKQTITRWTSFPFGKDRASVAGIIKGHIGDGHGPSDEVRNAILDEIQPFTDGKGEQLYGIHKLDITDKHEILIPTMTKFRLDGFRAVTADGKVININDFEINTLNPEVQKAGALTFRNVRLEMEKHAKASFDIGFQNGQPFEGQSIVHTLRDLLALTRGALKILNEATQDTPA